MTSASRVQKVRLVKMQVGKVPKIAQIVRRATTKIKPVSKNVKIVPKDTAVLHNEVKSVIAVMPVDIKICLGKMIASIAHRVNLVAQTARIIRSIQHLTIHQKNS